MTKQLRPGQLSALDIVGSREALVSVGMGAVFVACVVFGAMRGATQMLTGALTPWWGNALGAALIALMWGVRRINKTEGSAFVAHGTALIATLALLVPSFYGVTSSKWWLGLVGFAVLLMGRRAEAWVWTTTTAVLVPLVAAFESTWIIPGAIGESHLEQVASVSGFVLILFWITLAFRRVATERAIELESMAVSLKRSNDVRQQFLTHMSHEIRTPLHGVIAMTDLVLSDESPRDVRDHVQAAHDSAFVLLTLLNNIIDVTCAGTGAITLVSQPFKLHAALSEALSPLAAQATSKRIEIRAHAAPDVVEARIGDRARFFQIVLNLVGNAVKFTHKGKIEIELSSEANDPERIKLRVRDTGVGISKEQQTTIFEPFYRGSAGTEPGTAGAGLGLAITQSLVRLMKGKLHVESQPGEGSTFTAHFHLKCDPTNDEHFGPTELLSRKERRSLSPKAAAGITSGCRILVCEDDPTNRRALHRMLQHLGHDDTLVGDGNTAWEELQSEHYDVLITDIEMPGLDGLELTRKIRRAEDQSDSPQHLWIITATAHVGNAEEHLVLNAGADAFLPKPFTLEQLGSMIDQLSLGSVTSRTADAQHAKPTGKRLPTSVQFK